MDDDLDAFQLALLLTAGLVIYYVLRDIPGLDPAGGSGGFPSSNVDGGDMAYTPSGSYANPAAVDAIAKAIARQEGFYVAGSVPQRANNPGNLKLYWLPYPKIGAEGISVIPTIEEGWDRLRYQVDLMLTGRSQNYHPAMTIEQVARVWTQTQQPEWGRNVAAFLGVPTSTTLNEVALRYA